MMNDTPDTIQTEYGKAYISCYGPENIVFQVRDTEPWIISKIPYAFTAYFREKEHETGVLYRISGGINLWRTDKFMGKPTEKASRVVWDEVPKMVTKYIEDHPMFLRNGVLLSRQHELDSLVAKEGSLLHELEQVRTQIGKARMNLHDM